MSLNGKRDKFQTEDLLTFAKAAGLKKAKATILLREVAESIANWRRYAARAEVSQHDIKRIENTFRLHLSA
jgi:hypothetical protein